MQQTVVLNYIYKYKNIKIKILLAFSVKYDIIVYALQMRCSSMVEHQPFQAGYVGSIPITRFFVCKNIKEIPDRSRFYKECGFVRDFLNEFSLGYYPLITFLIASYSSS